jgi:hypothetical protein
VICETPPALDGAEADRLRETPRDGHRRVDRAPGGTSRGTGVSAEMVPAGAPETDELAKAGFRAQSGVLGTPGYPEHVDDGVRAARITDAVLGSATSGGWVDV